MNTQGKYFLIHKDWPSTGKKRRFYEIDELGDAEDTAVKYANENGRGYLLVQVIKEYGKDVQDEESV